jgi:hypothetical protein
LAADLDAFREKLKPAHAASPEADTRIERPRIADADNSISPAAERALRSEEAARALGFGRAIMFLAGGALLFLPFEAGVLWLRLVMGGMLCAMMVVSGWVWWRASKPSGYTRSVYRAYALTCVAACAILLYYGGVFSATPAVVTLGISFFGQGDDRRWALVLCSIAVATYFVIALGITIGVIPELGLFRGIDITKPAQLFAVVMVPAAFIVTLWQARLAPRRRAAHGAATRGAVAGSARGSRSGARCSRARSLVGPPRRRLRGG